MRTDILESKDQILLWISENRSKAFMCQEFKCKPAVLDGYLHKLGIEYKGNRGSKGTPHTPQRLTAEQYAKSTCVKSLILKKKLIEDGVKDDVCEKCGITEWQGEKMPTELHHKDGDHYNNNFDNLAILCCNCHALTDDYSVRKHFEPKKIIEKKVKVQKVKSNRSAAQYHSDVKNAYINSQFHYIDMVLTSGIDFTKFGWVTKLSDIIGKKPQRVHKWMKQFMPDFYNEKCFKRFSTK